LRKESFSIQIQNNSVTGYKLYPKELTSDTVLVFLHDALGNADSWKDFPEKTAKTTGLSAIVYNRPGHAISTTNPVSWGKGYLERETQFLDKVLNNLKVKQPILVGSSDGGSIALLYAEAHPVKAIVTLAAHYFVEEKTVIGVLKMREEPANSVLREALEKYHGPWTDSLVDNWQNVWTSEEFSDWNISRQLSNISCPALIIQGDEDAYAPASHATELAKQIGKNAEVHLIKNCGHFPHKDQPKTTLNLIEKFKKHLL
jgi:pimeloyl-ACP methyl ester carboxylesterase